MKRIDGSSPNSVPIPSSQPEPAVVTDLSDPDKMIQVEPTSMEFPNLRSSASEGALETKMQSDLRATELRAQLNQELNNRNGYFLPEVEDQVLLKKASTESQNAALLPFVEQENFKTPVVPKSLDASKNEVAIETIEVMSKKVETTE